MRRFLLIMLLFTLVGCGSRPVTERLGGTWSSPLATYQFDFNAATMTRTALGKTETKPISIVKQDANSITIWTDSPITITLVDDTTATIAQPGRIPLQLKRYP